MYFAKSVIFLLFLTISSIYAQLGDRVVLGNLETGATISFAHVAGGEWGIEISGGTATAIYSKKACTD